MSDHSLTRNGTMGGTLTIILANITTGELAKTVVLATAGAVVSYSVTLLLKWITRKRKGLP